MDLQHLTQCQAHNRPSISIRSMRKNTWMYQRHWLILRTSNETVWMYLMSCWGLALIQHLFATSDILGERRCGGQNPKMNPSDPHPCITSFPWEWVKPLNMMRYYSMIELVICCMSYVICLTWLWEREILGGPHLFTWAPGRDWVLPEEIGSVRDLMQGRFLLGAFNMDGATWQGIQVASRSWEWLPTDNQQGMETSVL